MSTFFRTALVILIITIINVSAPAQDTKAQYPNFLSKSYIGLHMGYIQYPFSRRQLEPGFQAESIRIPHLAVQVLLLGHHFNKYFSAQVSYMRPVNWVEYINVNGDQKIHYVWMNIAGLTVKSRLPVTKRFSVYGEGGLSIMTRKGFEWDTKPVVKDANYASVILGAGLQYQASKNWDLKLSAAYSPPHSTEKQPHTVFYSGGFNYNMRPLPKERVEKIQIQVIYFPGISSRWDTAPISSVMAPTTSFQKVPYPFSGVGMQR